MNDTALVAAAVTRDNLWDTTCGYAADEDIAEMFGVELGEDAETAAVQMADVHGLTLGHAERLVMVWAGDAVLAFFTGPSDAAVIEAAKGLSVDDAWDLPVVQKLLADHPLEWHDISELDAWLGDAR